MSVTQVYKSIHIPTPEAALEIERAVADRLHMMAVRLSCMRINHDQFTPLQIAACDSQRGVLQEALRQVRA